MTYRVSGPVWVELRYETLPESIPYLMHIVSAFDTQVKGQCFLHQVVGRKKRRWWLQLRWEQFPGSLVLWRACSSGKRPRNRNSKMRIKANDDKSLLIRRKSRGVD